MHKSFPVRSISPDREPSRFAARCLARRHRPFPKRLALPRAADGDRPQAGLPRTANRPGSQQVVWPENIALSQSASPCPRAWTGTVRGPSEAQDAVVIAKSSAAPWPILGVPDQVSLGRIVLDVTPSL